MHESPYISSLKKKQLSSSNLDEWSRRNKLMAIKKVVAAVAAQYFFFCSQHQVWTSLCRFRFKFISICVKTLKWCMHMKPRNVMISFANYNLLICVWKLAFYSLLLFYALVCISLVRARAHTYFSLHMRWELRLGVCNLLCSHFGEKKTKGISYFKCDYLLIRWNLHFCVNVSCCRFF